MINLGRHRSARAQDGGTSEYSTRCIDLVGGSLVIDIEGVDHPRRMFDLTEGLIRRATPTTDRGILGANFARALRTIWS
ncbi:MAG TPA: hypothetical protein VMT85_24780 [Thermoanaerobaculia bacterium]|nr:hypothetical protein [Thermoanaerobaculia bacterium]